MTLPALLVLLALLPIGAARREARETPYRSPSGGDFRIVHSGSFELSGGDWKLKTQSSRCGTGEALVRTRRSCGCLCSAAIFADGFESGDVGAWTAAVPANPTLD